MDYLIRIAAVAAFTFGIAVLGYTQITSPMLRTDIESFIQQMADKHRFDPEQLRQLFGQARTQSSIIRAINAPATARPWYEFRAGLITQRRIDAGVEFWNENVTALKRAQQEFGVPAEIIVATIGIETFYGRSSGTYRVIDALTTLAFDVPRRAEFFRGELEQFLLLTRSKGIDPLSVKGSYAAAMGIPQFLPSSYRAYARDYDGDGQADIWSNNTDAIGSVAYYYNKFGWEADGPVIALAHISADGYQEVLKRGIKPELSIGELAQMGVRPLGPYAQNRLASLIDLDTESGKQYWLGFNNFYVITRYNKSNSYAMAVYQLAQEIRSLREKLHSHEDAVGDYFPPDD